MRRLKGAGRELRAPRCGRRARPCGRRGRGRRAGPPSPCARPRARLPWSSPTNRPLVHRVLHLLTHMRPGWTPGQHQLLARPKQHAAMDPGRLCGPASRSRHAAALHPMAVRHARKGMDVRSPPFKEQSQPSCGPGTLTTLPAAGSTLARSCAPPCPRRRPHQALGALQPTLSTRRSLTSCQNWVKVMFFMRSHAPRRLRRHANVVPTRRVRHERLQRIHLSPLLLRRCRQHKRVGRSSHCTPDGHRYARLATCLTMLAVQHRLSICC